jgi:hypothetical protein
VFPNLLYRGFPTRSRSANSTRSNWPRAADLEIGGADVAFLKTVVRAGVERIIAGVGSGR